LGATRELLLPVTFLGCFALYYFARLPFGVVLACSLPMLLLYALSPLWAARSLARFDRDSVRLLAAHDPAKLRARYRRALGMRWFAAPGLRAERKAMVLLECGEPRAASHAYREAIDELGALAPPRVILGYAHASFAIGDDGAAISMYQRVIDELGALPGVERKLAHALVRAGRDLDRALELLERAQSEVGEANARGELNLLRALALAKRGEHERARALVAENEASSDSARELRDETERLLNGTAAVGARS
jgi:hypothetical protein